MKSALWGNNSKSELTLCANVSFVTIGFFFKFFLGQMKKCEKMCEMVMSNVLPQCRGCLFILVSFLFNGFQPMRIEVTQFSTLQKLQLLHQHSNII